MALIRPTRREFLASIPLVGASALAGRAFAQAEDESVNFLVVGDWGRNGHPNQLRVAEQMGEKAAERGSRFIASTGDNFYMFGVSSVRDRQWRTSFEDVYTHDGLRNLPWYPVLGNHDYGGDVEAQIRYGATSSRWQMGGHYYKETLASPGGGSVDLFFIDTVMWIGTEGPPFYFLGSRISAGGQQRQAEWLVRELRGSTARFKFVFGHHGIHSIGPHGGEMQMAQLDDVLRQYGVTAYVHGHDHCLFHITQHDMRSHRDMHYICSGGGSKVLATYTGGRAPGCVYDGFCDPAVFPHWPRNAFVRDAGFASFDVFSNRVEFSLLGLNGNPERAYRAELGRT